MKIENVNIEDLNEATYNPRRLTKKQYADIKASLKEFGMVENIVVNSHPDRKNIIIGGHQRVKVLKSMGIKEVPVHYISIEDENKEQELNVRLNKNVGEWDFDKLANEFEQEDLINWGFDESELLGDFTLNDEEIEENDENSDVDTMAEIKISCKKSEEQELIKYLEDKIREISINAIVVTKDAR